MFDTDATEGLHKGPAKRQFEEVVGRRKNRRRQAEQKSEAGCTTDQEETLKSELFRRGRDGRKAQRQRPGKRAGRSIQKIGRTLQLNDTGIAERSPPLAQCRQRRGGGPRETKQKTRRELFFHRPAFSETRSAEFRRAKAETEDKGAEAPGSDGPRRKTGTHGFSVHRQPTGWPQDPKVCKARFQIQREFGNGNAFRSAESTDPKSA